MNRNVGPGPDLSGIVTRAGRARRQFLFEPDIVMESGNSICIEISNTGLVQLSPALFGYFLVPSKSNKENGMPVLFCTVHDKDLVKK